MTRKTHSLLCWMLTALIAVSTGCGQKGDRPELAHVTGLVTMNGAPLANAQVAFEPTTGRPSYGRTDQDGKYTLRYLHNAQGAMLGNHTVRISTNTMVVDPASGSEKLLPETVPPQYNKDSVLTANVLEGNNDIVFELKAAGR